MAQFMGWYHIPNCNWKYFYKNVEKENWKIDHHKYMCYLHYEVVFHDFKNKGKTRNT